jgi:hypothetical protein
MIYSLDQAISSSRTVKNFSKHTCEAYGCSNGATKRIIVSVGNLGDIDLNLCKNCVLKFNDSIVDENNNGELTALEQQLTPEVRTMNPNGTILSTA